MGNKSEKFMTSTKMLDWQYFQILGEIGLIEGHAQDFTCPCRLSEDWGENCLAKHSLLLSKLCSETAAMEPNKKNADILFNLAEDAKEKHEKMRGFLCHFNDEPEFLEWSRQWRKTQLEPLYYHQSCKLVKSKAAAHLHADVPICTATFPVCPVNEFTEKKGGDNKMEDKAEMVGKTGVCQSLTSALADESKAGDEYRAIAFAAKHEHMPDVARTLNSIARIEDTHHAKIEGLVEKNCEASLHDPLLAQIASQICSTGACFAAPARKYPVCRGAKVKKLESCILKGKERNIEAGCAPEGDGSKKCPVPFAVCTTSLKCHAKAGAK